MYEIIGMGVSDFHGVVTSRFHTTDPVPFQLQLVVCTSSNFEIFLCKSVVDFLITRNNFEVPPPNVCVQNFEMVPDDAAGVVPHTPVLEGHQLGKVQTIP